MAFGPSQFSRLSERSITEDSRVTWRELCTCPLCPHMLLSGCKTPKNTGFRKRRGSEPRVLKLNDREKACKDFPKFTLIFPCKQENVAFVKRIKSSFFRKSRALYGMALVLFLQFPSSRIARGPQTPRYHGKAGCSYPVLLMYGMDPPFCQFTSSHRASPPKPDTVRNLHSNILLPKTYSSPK